MTTTDALTSPTLTQALAVLHDEGGRLSPNVWSCRIEAAERVLRSAIAAGVDCGARLHGALVVALPTVGMGATQRGWTDRYPYEVVRVISATTIEVRAMSAVIDPTWKPDFVRGGFCGTVVNQSEQRWTITSNPEAKPLRILLQKDGSWKSTEAGAFIIGKAVKFHDYNF